MSLQGKTTILDNFELGGEDEMQPLSSMTFFNILMLTAHLRPDLVVMPDCFTWASLESFIFISLGLCILPP